MKKKILFALQIIVFIFYLLYLEIYKNRIFGWVIAIALFACILIIRKLVLSEKTWWKKLLFNLIFIAAFIGNAMLSAPKEEQVKAYEGSNPEYTEEYTVNEGKLVGIFNEDKSVEVFAGVPYAAPPVGDLRWKEPKPASKWDGVKVCDTYAPMAMQKRSNPIYAFGSQIVGYNEIPVSLNDNFIEAMSEDCLYLNIWKPTDAKPGDNLPVLFYIHGGSLNSGQSYYYAYNGENLASKGIIFVDIAYRVGVFGYMADEELIAESKNGTTGNYGLLDQIAALQWVNDNIEVFGGDVSNITIAGESAGSSSVNAVCVSPLAKGLFRRAIAESSGITPKVPYHTFRDMDYALQIGNSIEEEFNCKSIDELRKVPADELVYTSFQNNEMTVDGYAIKEQPYLTYLKGENNEEALFNGYNGDEADAFVMFSEMPDVDSYEEYLKEIAGDYASELVKEMPVTTDNEAKLRYKELLGVAWFAYSHYTWSELMSAEDRPTYLYYFTKDNKGLGDWHSGEMIYFYGNIPDNNNYDESDRALSETIQSYILNYVKTGNPNGSDLPEWKSYNEAPDEILLLGDTVGMEKNKYNKLFAIFDKYMESIE